jgi:Na+-transporting NADH:ubiquinone oxidoreductase subunit NqrF
MPSASNDVLYAVCGPPIFNELAIKLFKELGANQTNIHKF